MKNFGDIKKIAVVGAGTMGAGIAQVLAMTGYDVIMYDVKDEALDKAKKTISGNLDKGIEKGKVTEKEKEDALSNISFTSVFDDLKVDLVIEAIIEKLDLKQDLFKRLAEINPTNTILATNTSTIPIAIIAEQVPAPERVVGMHFFNPVHIMKLVEVISGDNTANEVTNTIISLAEKMGKAPVKVADEPGFIVNRVARHFYIESLKVLEDGVTDHATLDQLIESSGFRMGPFRLMDLIGVDSNLNVTTSMYEAFGNIHKFKPSKIQQELVEKGHYGRKSGRGFYEY